VDSFRFTEIHKEITELKKAAVKKENEKKEMADVVEQDKLAEIKGGSRLVDLVRDEELTSLGEQERGQ
jgi:nucleosome binding factor SPN SPT16 subunit